MSVLPNHRHLLKTALKPEGVVAVASSELVLLRCPDCKRERRVAKHESDPSATVTIETTCPECDHRRGGGTFDDPTYLDKNGQQIKAQ